MFAIELMLPEVSVDTFLPVAIATGAATFVGRWFFGDQPAFQVPTIVAMTPHANTVTLLLLYTALGGLVGVAAAGFIRGIHLVEDIFDRIPWRYARHMLGMLLVGVLMYALFRAFGQYYVDGVGYGDDREHSGRRHVGGLAARLAACLQGACDVDQPRLGILGRNLFAVAVHGRDFGRRLRLASCGRGPANSAQHPRLCDGRHGRDGRRRHRRADDRRHDDFRDDARLRYRHAADSGGRRQRRRAAPALQGKHLHAQVGPARARAAQGSARQHVPGAPCARGHGPKRVDFACRAHVRVVLARPEDATPLSSCRGDAGGSALRRHPRQRRALARHGGRADLGDARRRRQPRFHDRPRGGDRIRRHRPDVAQKARSWRSSSKEAEFLTPATSSASSPRSTSPTPSRAA